MSGGTKIKITGKYLNAGSDIKAFLNQQLPCEILSTDPDQALCKTAPAPGIIEGGLVMHFDNGVREFGDYNFKYVEDPTIETVSSGPSGQLKIPRGIPAGGIAISVIGSQFQAIQNPKMHVFYENKIFLSECEVLSNTEMKCLSPAIDVEGENLDPESPALLEYGFEMDRVEKLRKRSGFFELYPNPVYFKFEEKIKYYNSEYLTINGKNLDRACKEGDVRVYIGRGVCNITSLSRQQLTCRPPGESDETGEFLYIFIFLNYKKIFSI